MDRIFWKRKAFVSYYGGPGSSHADMHSYDGLSDSSTLIFIDFFGRGKSDTAYSPIEYSIEGDV
ncbi:MAG: hypothetical protein IPL24_19270 [Bacteroidetes bacterium]|nr:hypothetical protein [Bacteroidota bacterium]